MKKKKKKEIRVQIQEGLNLIVSSVDISKPSRKLKKLIESQAKRLSVQITRDLDKLIKKEEKELLAVSKKIKAEKKPKKKKVLVG